MTVLQTTLNNRQTQSPIFLGFHVSVVDLADNSIEARTTAIYSPSSFRGADVSVGTQGLVIDTAATGSRNTLTVSSVTFVAQHMWQSVIDTFQVRP